MLKKVKIIQAIAIVPENCLTEEEVKDIFDNLKGNVEFVELENTYRKRIRIEFKEIGVLKIYDTASITKTRFLTRVYDELEMLKHQIGGTVYTLKTTILESDFEDGYYPEHSLI